MRLFTRSLSAVVVFMFLVLVFTMLAVLAGGSAAPLVPAVEPLGIVRGEVEEVLRVLEGQTDSTTAILTFMFPIVLLAGFSEAIGHAVILFANRVRPNRFAATLLINALLFSVSYFLWVGSITTVSIYIFKRETATVQAMLAVGLSYLPLLYGFLIALPGIGVLISNLLYMLTALMLYNLLQVFFLYTPSEALLCAIYGLLGVLGFRLTIGRPVAWFTGRLRDAVAGTRMQNSVEQALAYEDRIASRGQKEIAP